MSDAPSAPGKLTELPANEPRLESWGEIATYLRRDIRTVQRWESLHGLPVRRLQIGKQGQVFAYRSELDRWMRQRQPGPNGDVTHSDNGSPETPIPMVVSEAANDQTTTGGKSTGWRWKAAVLGLLLLASLGWINPIHDWIHDVLFPPETKRSEAHV